MSNMATRRRWKPLSLHRTKSCFITVNYVLFFAIAVTVLCLNANWFVLFTTDEREHNSAGQRSQFENLNFSSVHLRIPTNLHREGHVRSGIVELRSNNLRDDGLSQDSVSSIQRAPVKHHDDVINKSHSSVINNVVIGSPRKSNVTSHSSSSSFVCPILINLDLKKHPSPNISDPSAELRKYRELSNITSYIPWNAIPPICEFLRRRSSIEIESFQNHVKQFEENFGVPVTAISKTVRYLFSLKTLSILGYDRKLPSALIIGSKKAGTTALRFTLNLHPQVNLPKRELEFFSRPAEFERGLDYYRLNLGFCRTNEINAEKSPNYFPTESVPKRVHESIGGKVKLILCVRDPVQRTISDFHHMSYKRMKITDMLLQTKDSEGERFSRELFDENGRLKRNLTIITQSLYSRHLRNWLQYFTLDDFLIVREEDIGRNLTMVMEEVERFLNVEPFFQSDMFTYKRRSCVRLPEGTYCAPRWGVELPGPRVNKNVIRVLRDYFRPFNQEFEKMTNTNFSWTNL